MLKREVQGSGFPDSSWVRIWVHHPTQCVDAECQGHDVIPVPRDRSSRTLNPNIELGPKTQREGFPPNWRPFLRGGPKILDCYCVRIELSTWVATWPSTHATQYSYSRPWAIFRICFPQLINTNCADSKIAFWRQNICELCGVSTKADSNYIRGSTVQWRKMRRKFYHAKCCWNFNCFSDPDAMCFGEAILTQMTKAPVLLAFR